MEDVTKDIKDFHKLQPNKKLAVFGIILFVFIVSIFIGVFLSRRGALPTTPEKKDMMEVAQDKTSLTLSPSATSVAIGETVTVSVMLNQTPIQAVDVVINFDPTLFAASDIVNGAVYEDILRSEVADGQVIVSAAVSPTDPTNLKAGELFTFTLEALAPSDNATLEFDPELTITAKNGVNTLGAAEAVTLTVTQ